MSSILFSDHIKKVFIPGFPNNCAFGKFNETYKISVLYKNSTLIQSMLKPIDYTGFQCIKRIEETNTFIINIPGDGRCAIYSLFTAFHIQCIFCATLVIKNIKWKNIDEEDMLFYAKIFTYIQNGDFEFPTSMIEAYELLYHYFDEESKTTLDEMKTSEDIKTLDNFKCFEALEMFINEQVKKINKSRNVNLKNVPHDTFMPSMNLPSNSEGWGVQIVSSGAHFNVHVNSIILQLTIEYLSCHGYSSFHYYLESFLKYFYYKTNKKFNSLNLNWKERTGNFYSVFKSEISQSNIITETCVENEINKQEKEQIISQPNIITETCVENETNKQEKEQIISNVLEKYTFILENVFPDALEKSNEQLQLLKTQFEKLSDQQKNNCSCLSDDYISKVINNSIISEKKRLNDEIIKLEKNINNMYYKKREMEKELPKIKKILNE